jgi:SAM-dependent methyltransferase
VVGIEMHAGRAGGARRLTARVGLASSVEVVRGDASRLPFRAAAFDACVSQEALLHIGDKPAVLRECRRVLAPRGRLAFTDWISRPALSHGERRRLEEWMAATTLQSLGGYRDMLGDVGFQAVDAEDLSAEWRPLLHRRLAMYRALRADTVARHGHAHYEAYDQLYTFFVGLVEKGRLGGGRFTATR